jgi:hypothetical protein
MAVIWADFPSGETGLYGTNRDLMLNGVWSAFEGVAGHVFIANDPDPNIGSVGRVLRVGVSGTVTSAGAARFALPSGATQTVGVGFRMWLDRLPPASWTSHSPLISFRTVGNNNVVNFTVLPNGAMAAAQTSAGGTPYGQSTIPVIVANAWNHVEIKVIRSSTVGEIEVRVNGIVVPGLDLDALNLGANDPAIITFAHNGGLIANVATAFYKDIVFWDDTGSQNNDFIGSVIVKHLRPNADVNLNGWTTSSGSTGFNLINVSPPNDSTFIQADDTLPGIAQFDINNLPPDIVTVKALIPITRSRKIDGGDGNLQTGLTGTLTDLGTDKPITTAFTYRWDVSELSPDTGTPWTPVEVDAVRFDIDRTL